MIRAFLRLSGEYPIDRTSAATMTACYIAIKQDMLDQVRSCMTELADTGIKFTSETTPSGDSQTLYSYFDTAWGYQLRISTTLTVNNSSTAGYNVTASVGYAMMKNNVVIGFYGAATMGNTIYNYPRDFQFDHESFLLVTKNLVRIGIVRTNFVWSAPFFTSDYALVRYKDLRTEEYVWGGVLQSTAGMPINTITTAVTAVAYPAQITSGQVRSDGQLYKALVLDEIYFNETATASTAFIAKMDKDDELLYVTGGASTIFTTGNKVRVGDKTYYAALNLNGKIILAEI